MTNERNDAGASLATSGITAKSAAARIANPIHPSAPAGCSDQ
jgi:hypothetical protein